MKYLLLLTLAGLYTLASSGQSREEFYDHEWKKCDQKKAFFSGQLSQTDSGVMVKDYYLANGQLQMSGKYADFDRKIKNGHFTYYFTDGTISREGAYEADQRNGVWKTYYPNGQLKSLLYFLNNRVGGTGKYWYSNGQLADSIYNENDTLKRISWFSNGTVATTGILHKITKRPVSNWTYYSRNGKKSMEVVFDEYSKVVTKACYDEKGALVAEPKSRTESSPAKWTKWEDYLQENLKEPEHVELPKGKRKIVIVGFNLDENGAVINAFVKAPLHPEYDKAALALLNNSPEWVASRNYNREQRMGEIFRMVDFAKVKKKKQKS
ncbi:MAG: hypothetical protein JNM21_04700 [Taibaiella sp.]|nr:hypothetical protein [Taibaiella sp.]